MQLLHIIVIVLGYFSWLLIHSLSQIEVLIVKCEEGVDATHTSLESGLSMGKIGLIGLIVDHHNLTAQISQKWLCR